MSENQYLWTIDELHCKSGTREGCSFRIHVNAKLFEASKKACELYPHEVIQQRAREMANRAGLRVLESDELVLIRRNIVMHFKYPNSDACVLHIDDPNCEEPTYSCHNVDLSIQQSFLLSLWVMWVHGIEHLIEP